MGIMSFTTTCPNIARYSQLACVQKYLVFIFSTQKTRRDKFEKSRFDTVCSFGLILTRGLSSLVFNLNS